MLTRRVKISYKKTIINELNPRLKIIKWIKINHSGWVHTKSQIYTHQKTKDDCFVTFDVSFVDIGSEISTITYWNYNSSQNIWDKLWLLCEIVANGKSSISIFEQCLDSIEKIFTLTESLDTSL